MGLVNVVKSVILIREIKKLDPEKEADKLADLIEQVLDDSMGSKKSEEIQKVIVPFVNKFSMAFTKRLLEDQKGAK